MGLFTNLILLSATIPTLICSDATNDNVIDLQELLQDTSLTLREVKTALLNCNRTAVPVDQDKKQPRDCADIFKSGTREDGVYRIWPSKWEISGSFEVLCDMNTDGGGWTVFQKRGNFSNPDNFFFETWKEYKNGFGDLTKEFWLGNDRIFSLSNQGSYQLRVDVKDMNNSIAFAKYNQFWIENEAQLYRLQVRGFSGNAGDSLSGQARMRFTTKDSDNDIYLEGNCANLYKGGWWYHKCHGSNLNGLNLKGPHTSYADGIIWASWKGAHYSVFSEMKIRPADFVSIS